MTVCGDSSPISADRGSSPCSSPSLTVNRRKDPGKRFRSTKGASKARRDHINGEIGNMRCLLPISPEDRERLSYLHCMAAICTYVRKSVFFRALGWSEGASPSVLCGEFLQALPGFIVAVTGEGKLIYVSENVSEYLGSSMVELLQGDSFYDMVERKDVDVVKSHLEDDSSPAAERAFVCRMQTSKPFRLRHGGNCTMLITGRFQTVPQSPPSDPDPGRVFVALCTPTVNRRRDGDLRSFAEHFETRHRADMTLTHLSDSAPFCLGYSAEDMIGQSWYGLLHPEDLALAVEAHKILMQGDEQTLVEMVLRLQCQDLSWKHLYIRAAKDSGNRTVTCSNYVISETEAKFLRQKIYTDVPGLSGSTHLQNPPQSPSPHVRPCHRDDAVTGLKRRRLPSRPSAQPQRKTSRLSEPDASCADLKGALSSTPPHSPASSQSPPPREEVPEPDFLLDMCRYAGGHMPLPGALAPPYLSYPDTRCPPTSPSEPLRPSVRHDLHLSDVAVTTAPSPASSPSYEFPRPPADARLVPDRLPTPGVSEGLSDFTFHPEALAHPLTRPGSAPEPRPTQGAPPPTPDPSPAPGGRLPYSEREREEISILARQISSLASSFDMYRTTVAEGNKAPPLSSTDQTATPPAFAWPRPAHQPLKPELVLDEAVIDSILKDLDRVPGPDALPCSSSMSRFCSQVTRGPRDLEAAGLHSDGLSFAALVEGLSHEQLPGASALDPCIQAPGLQENIELNQLNHFLHRDLQQDGHFAESMY